MRLARVNPRIIKDPELGRAIQAAEKLPPPFGLRGRRLYTVGLLACIGSLMFGYNLGFIGGCITLPSFHRDFNLPPLDTSEYSYVTSNIVTVLQGGAFFGCLVTFPITEMIGRKFSLSLASLAFLLGSGIMTFSSGTLSLLYTGRLITGLGVGSASLLVPMYISEIAPPDIRGLLVGLWEFFNQISALLGFWINFIVLKQYPHHPSSQWQISSGLQLAPGGMLLIASVLFMPESPRWLLRKGKRDKAVETLVWLRQLQEESEYVGNEIRAMQEQVERETIQAPSVGQMIKELFLRGNRNRLAIGVVMMLFQNSTGINAMNFYSPAIFRSIGLVGVSAPLLASGIWALIKTLATLISMLFLIDRIGRRPLLLAGAVGVVITMFYIGGYITASGLSLSRPLPASSAATGDTANFNGSIRGPAAWIAMIAIYIYAISFCIAWNSIPWIYCAEIFPNRLRSLCVSITTATQWIAQFAVARGTPYMLIKLGGGTYFFFGALMVLAVIWVGWWLPETKGRTLEGMDAVFGTPVASASGRGRNPGTGSGPGLAETGDGMVPRVSGLVTAAEEKSQEGLEIVGELVLESQEDQKTAEAMKEGRC
ncbi:general substrate transporter [Pyronema omphalodes]|nr:general substrate transporter [Pyronema omphalodes]